MDEEELNKIETFTNNLVITLKVFAGGISFLSVFLSMVFIYLLGIVNGLQIQALSCLFKVRLPINSMMIMTVLLKFA